MNDNDADAAGGPDAPPAPDAAAAPAAAAPAAADDAGAAAPPAVGKAKKGRRENITPHTKGLLNNYFTAAGAQRWTDDERIAMVKFLLEQDQFKHLDIPCVTRIYNLYIKATAMSKQIASLLADAIKEMTDAPDQHGLSYDVIVGLVAKTATYFDADGCPSGLPEPLLGFLERCTDAHCGAAQGRMGVSRGQFSVAGRANSSQLRVYSCMRILRTRARAGTTSTGKSMLLENPQNCRLAVWSAARRQRQ